MEIGRCNLYRAISKRYHQQFRTWQPLTVFAGAGDTFLQPLTESKRIKGKQNHPPRFFIWYGVIKPDASFFFFGGGQFPGNDIAITEIQSPLMIVLAFSIAGSIQSPRLKLSWRHSAFCYETMKLAKIFEVEFPETRNSRLTNQRCCS